MQTLVHSNGDKEEGAQGKGKGEDDDDDDEEEEKVAIMIFITSAKRAIQLAIDGNSLICYYI